MNAKDTVQSQAERGDLRPIPDPTVLTTRAQESAISALREIIETRLDAMDKAIELARVCNEAFPGKLHEIMATIERHKEKFDSISNQFTLRDVAVAAALKAAQEAVFAQQISNKEANNKMEAGFTKLIDSSTELLVQVRSGIESKIDDIKTRLTGIESHKKGSVDMMGYVIGAGGLIVAAAAFMYRHQ